MSKARVEIDRFIRDHPDWTQKALAEYIDERFAPDSTYPISQPRVSEHLHHMLPTAVEDLMSLLHESAADLFEEVVKEMQGADGVVDKMLYAVLAEQILYMGRNGPDLKAALSAATILKNKKVDALEALRELLGRGGATTEVHIVEGGGAGGSQAAIDGVGPVGGDGGPRLQLPAIPGRPEATGPDVVGPGAVLGERREAGEPAVAGELVGED